MCSSRADVRNLTSYVDLPSARVCIWTSSYQEFSQNAVLLTISSDMVCYSYSSPPYSTRHTVEVTGSMKHTVVHHSLAQDSRPPLYSPLSTSLVRFYPPQRANGRWMFLQKVAQYMHCFLIMRVMFHPHSTDGARVFYENMRVDNLVSTCTIGLPNLYFSCTLMCGVVSRKPSKCAFYGNLSCISNALYYRNI